MRRRLPAGDSAGASSRRRLPLWVVLVLALLALPSPAQVNVLTYLNDNSRSGQNLQETVLSRSTVRSAGFGKVFSRAVDGYVYAQPLYRSDVTIPGRGVHNVVYVATEHDTVYAFDADSSDPPDDAPLWSVSFTSAAQGVSTVPSTELGCGVLVPEVGITGTPVIDEGTGTLYVVAKTKEPGRYVQRLHALDVTDGAEKFGGPVEIVAAVAGSGDGNVGGNIAFDPFREIQRTGLLLANGVVYMGWASLCDIGPYHGWVIGYDAATLQPVSVFNTTPDGGLGGVWESGAAPAADADGNVYLVTGNGSFDADSGGRDYGDSVLKLRGATVVDFFTPFNEAALSAADLDLGSSSTLLLPDQPGAHRHLLVTAGKDATIYVVDRDDMGRRGAQDNRQIVQSIAGALRGGVFGAAAYWNDSVYYVSVGDVPKAFQLAGGRLSTSARSQANTTFRYPGATPVISANGAVEGILWAVEMDASQQLVLHAYDATDLSQGLYDSAQAGERGLGQAVKFTPPLVANGKVYVAGAERLTVFGVTSPAPTATPSPTPARGPSGGGGCAVVLPAQTPSIMPVALLVLCLLLRMRPVAQRRDRGR